MHKQMLDCLHCSRTRIEANGGVEGGAHPPGDHFSEIMFSRQVLRDLNANFWRILRRNDALKHRFISVDSLSPKAIQKSLKTTLKVDFARGYINTRHACVFVNLQWMLSN